MKYKVFAHEYETPTELAEWLTGICEEQKLKLVAVTTEDCFIFEDHSAE